MSELFSSIDTIDPYGHAITIYRSADAKVEVILFDRGEDGTSYEDGYWWFKVKTANGPSRSGALNFSNGYGLVLIAILTEIHNKHSGGKIQPEFVEKAQNDKH
ncbi:MAG: hypothetical protein AAB834_03460 [Patescibacteria group bacterium]